MRRFPFLLLVVLGFTATSNAFALDVVHFKNGKILKCKIDAVTDNILNYYTTVSSAGLRTIQMKDVEYIDFGFSEGEEVFFSNLEQASTEALKNAWTTQYGNLHRPRSRTAKYGLAYADALLKEESEFSQKTALDIFDRVGKKAWLESDRATAYQGHLRALIRLGELDRALKDAAAYAKETEDPAILIEVRFLQAKVEFEQLRKLVAENPKWEEDDEIRPRRNELYHSSVDQFLWPFLFHGTNEESSVRGLRAAAEVYRSVGELEQAKACLDDLARLYPNHTIKPQKEE